MGRTPGRNRSNLNRSEERCSIITTPLILLVGVLYIHLTTYHDSRFSHDVDQIGIKYRIKEHAVLQIKKSIKAVYKRQDTVSFMFVYNSNLGNFNRNEFNDFVNAVSVTASKYLRNQESIPVYYTLVEGSNLDTPRHRELTTTLYNHFGKTGVMLVKHVEAIPSALAMAFHPYCDQINPLVKKSAVFFTLNLAKCPEVTEKKVLNDEVKKCLAQKWDGVSADRIGPLLTRVVSVVIDVRGAF